MSTNDSVKIETQTGASKNTKRGKSKEPRLTGFFSKLGHFGEEQEYRKHILAAIVAFVLENPPDFDSDDLKSRLREHIASLKIEVSKSKADDITEYLSDAKLDSMISWARENVEQDWLHETNNEYFVLNDGGTPLVCRVVKDHALERDILERYSFENIRKLHCNDLVELYTDSKGKKVFAPRFDAWLKHRRRREYMNGAGFFPNQTAPASVYNLWRGFAIPAEKGDWSKIRFHIEEVICGGDKTLSEYLLQWIARCLQKPAEVGGVAVVLQGGRGTGKGTLGNFLLRIFGQHGLYLTQASHLVGKFNAHLRDAALIFADEAFYAGDKQHEGALKALITDPYITIEAKFQNAVTVRNCVSLLLATNESWAVPAGADERRYCVIRVSERVQQDRNYFGELRAQADSGGLAAMLFDMLEMDLSGFDVFAVPKTAALAEQKLHSLTGTLRWLHHCLMEEGFSSEESPHDVKDWGEDGVRVGKKFAHNSFLSHRKLHREYRVADIGTWAKEVRSVFGASLVDRRVTDENGNRKREWLLPPLSEGRKLFEKHLRVSALEWPSNVQNVQGSEALVQGPLNTGGSAHDVFS